MLIEQVLFILKPAGALADDAIIGISRITSKNISAVILLFINSFSVIVTNILHLNYQC